MNRTETRAPARRISREKISRTAKAGAAGRRKQSHRIPPQRCVLWVPDYLGYIADFSPQGVAVVERAELARHYDEDEAASAALAFREVTGLPAKVRPVYSFQHASA